MAAYGAELVLTPKEIGTKGAIAKAKEIVAATPGAWMPQQFDNPANVDDPPAHHGAGDPQGLPRGASTTSSRASARAATSPASARC